MHDEISCTPFKTSTQSRLFKVLKSVIDFLIINIYNFPQNKKEIKIRLADNFTMILGFLFLEIWFWFFCTN